MAESIQVAVARTAISLLRARVSDHQRQAAACKLVANKIAEDAGLPDRYPDVASGELVKTILGEEFVPPEYRIVRPEAIKVSELEFHSGPALDGVMMSTSGPVFVGCFPDLCYYLGHNPVSQHFIAGEAAYADLTIQLGMLMTEIGKSGHAKAIAQKIATAVLDHADEKASVIIKANS